MIVWRTLMYNYTCNNIKQSTWTYVLSPIHTVPFTCNPGYIPYHVCYPIICHQFYVSLHHYIQIWYNDVMYIEMLINILFITRNIIKYIHIIYDIINIYFNDTHNGITFTHYFIHDYHVFMLLLLQVIRFRNT